MPKRSDELQNLTKKYNVNNGTAKSGAGVSYAEAKKGYGISDELKNLREKYGVKPSDTIRTESRPYSQVIEKQTLPTIPKMQEPTIPYITDTAYNAKKTALQTQLNNIQMQGHTNQLAMEGYMTLEDRERLTAEKNTLQQQAADIQKQLDELERQNASARYSDAYNRMTEGTRNSTEQLGALMAERDKLFGTLGSGAIKQEDNDRILEIQGQIKATERMLAAEGFTKEEIESLSRQSLMNYNAAETKKLQESVYQKALDRTGAGNLLARTGTSLVSGVGAIDLAIQNMTAGTDAITGQRELVDYNTAWQRSQHRNVAVTEAHNENIVKKYNEKYGEGTKKAENAIKASTFANNIAASIGQSAAVVGLTALGVPGATLLLGGSAATATMHDFHEQGYTDGQALTMGLIAGAAETITEKIGIDNLFALKEIKGLTGKALATAVWKNLRSQAMSEAGEEGLSNVMNTIAEVIVLGDESTFNREVEALVKQGMDRKAAQAQVLKNWALNLGSDMLAGGLSGMFFGAAQAPVSILSRNLDAEIEQEKAAEEQGKGKSVEKAAEKAVEAIAAETTEPQQTTQQPQQTGQQSAQETMGETPTENAQQQNEAQTGVQAAQEGANAQQTTQQQQPQQKTKRGEIINRTGRELKNLNKQQRAGLNAASVLSRILGNRVHVYESTTDTAGNMVMPQGIRQISAGKAAPNGFYDPKTGDIYIDLNAGDTGAGTIAYTLAHEYTHFMKQFSAEKFDALASFLEENWGGETMADRIRAQQEKAREYGKELSEEEAKEEVVADAMEAILTDTDAVEKLEQMREADPKLFEKFMELVRKLLTNLKEAYGDIDPDSEEGKIVKSMQDKLEEIAQLYAEGLDEAGRKYEESIKVEEVSAEPVEVTEAVKNSYRSLAKAAGFTAVENEDGSRAWVRDNDIVTEVTVEDIEKSPIGNFINFSLEEKDITKEEADAQKKLFAEICTMAAQTNEFSMTMQFAGSAVFTGIKSNADKQYGTTYDFPSICTKTQAVIDSMSKAMVEAGRGLTTEEIEYVYRKVFHEGNPVPCPECYVFSRWIGIGSLLDNISKYQQRYGSMTAEEVQDAYAEMEKKIEAAAEEAGLTKGKAKGKLASEYTKKYNKLKEEIEKADNQGEKVSQEKRDTLASLEAQMDNVKAMTWIHTVYFANESHTKVNPRWKVPADVLFDLNNGETFATQYKEAWGFRTTQGAGYGKAITPYAEAELGEGILGTNSVNKLAKDKKAGKVENPFLKQEWTEADKKTLRRARAKQKNQAFIGGQRFQSTSDARFENASDYLLAALEMQAMHGMVQAYTKVPGAVPAFAAWGFSTNQSLMPKGTGLDENGNPIDTSVGGMNPEVAKENREKWDTQGTITIGVNDNHIRTIIRQAWRDFVIPYHASGGKANVVNEFRKIQDQGRVSNKTSTDYSKTQSEKELSDIVLTWMGKTDAEIEQIHKNRAARIAILTGAKSVDMETVRNNKFLSDLYDKLNGGEWDGVKVAKGVVASSIFPNEYWDTELSYEESGKIVEDYLEYCEDLGFLHKFSGMVPRDGQLKTIRGYDENGERVDLTDLAYEYEDGKKTDRVNQFYWKLLTDRRMYDNQGSYLPQQLVKLSATTPETVTEFAKTGRYGARAGRQYNAETSEKTAGEAAERIRDNTWQEENEQLKELNEVRMSSRSSRRTEEDAEDDGGKAAHVVGEKGWKLFKWNEKNGEDATVGVKNRETGELIKERVPNGKTMSNDELKETALRMLEEREARGRALTEAEQELLLNGSIYLKDSGIRAGIRKSEETWQYNLLGKDVKKDYGQKYKSASEAAAAALEAAEEENVMLGLTPQERDLMRDGTVELGDDTKGVTVELQKVKGGWRFRVNVGNKLGEYVSKTYQKRGEAAGEAIRIGKEYTIPEKTRTQRALNEEADELAESGHGSSVTQPPIGRYTREEMEAEEDRKRTLAEADAPWGVGDETRARDSFILAEEDDTAWERDEKAAAEDMSKTLEEYNEVLRGQLPVKSESSAEEKVVSNVKVKKAPLKKRAQDWWRSLVRSMINTGDTIHRIAKETGMKALDGYYFRALAARQAGTEWIAGKRHDIMGRKIGQGLNEIFDPIRAKGRDYYEQFQLYLFHMHNIDRMNRDYSAEAREAQEEVERLLRVEPGLAKLSEAKLKEIAESASIDAALAQDYLDALRKRDAAEAKRAKPVFGFDVTAEDSQAAVERLLEKHPEFEELAQQVYGYTNDLLQMRVDAGLMKQEDKNHLQKVYPHYVPTFRAAADEEAKVVHKGGLVVSKAIGKATGGDGVLLPLHVALARQTMAVTKNAAINRLGLALLEARDNHDSVKDYILNVEKTENGFSEDSFDENDSYEPRKENVVTIIENGKRYDMTLDEGLSDAFKAFEPDKLAGKTATKVTKAMVDLFKKLVTAYNPLFVIRNAVRDVQDAALYSKDIKAWAENYLPAWRELTKGGKYSDMYKGLGGDYASFFDYATGEVRAEKTGVFGKIELLNRWVEAAPRLAEFMAVVKKAESTGELTEADLMEAFEAAQDVTTNFGRAGSIGKVANKYFVPFLNPSIQGADKFIRGITETKGAKAWAQLAVKAAALGIAPTILNALLYRDDDEWEDISDANKANYYLFKARDGVWIKIPKGRAIATLSSAAVAATEAMRGDELDPREYLDIIATNIAPQNPLEANIFKAWFDADLFQPNSKGKTWYGGEIESERMQSYRPGERYDESTDIISKWIGDKLNLSPAKINYIIDQYSGVAGDLFLPLLTPQAERGPLSKAFTIDTVTNNETTGEYYDLMDELKWDMNSGDIAAGVTSRYMSHANEAVSDYYAEIREIEADDSLTNREKKRLVRELYRGLTQYQKEIIETAEKYRTEAEKYFKSNPGMDYTDDDAVRKFMREYNAMQSDEKYYKDMDEAENLMEAIAYREINRKTLGAEYALEVYSDSVYEKARSAKTEAGISYETYYDFYFGTKDLYADKDENGESISGSRKAKVLGFIDEMEIPDEQKYELAIRSDNLNQKEIEAIRGAGVTFDTYFDYYYGTKDMTADKDANGKSISGTKKKKVLGFIAGMDIPDDQKDALAVAAGYKVGSWKDYADGKSGKSGGKGGRRKKDKPLKLNDDLTKPAGLSSKRSASIAARGAEYASAYADIQKVTDRLQEKNPWYALPTGNPELDEERPAAARYFKTGEL